MPAGPSLARHIRPLAYGAWVVAVGLWFLAQRRAQARGAPDRLQAASRWGPDNPAAWLGLIRRTVAEFTEDRIPVIAAGVTFFALLALFPAMAAFVALYGLFGDMSDAYKLLHVLRGVLPDGAVSVISDQVARIYQARHEQLGPAFFIGLAISFWSSHSGVKALVDGLNVAYESREKRGFIKLSLISLALTAGAIVLPVLLLVAASRLPELLWPGHAAAVPFIGYAKWPATVLVVGLALSVLYRYGPCRARATWRWLTPGGLFAAVAWLAMTFGYSTYVLQFGHFDRNYGPLGALIGFMTWMWLGLIVVFFGAELNAEIEHQPDD